MFEMGWKPPTSGVVFFERVDGKKDVYIVIVCIFIYLFNYLFIQLCSLYHTICLIIYVSYHIYHLVYVFYLMLYMIIYCVCIDSLLSVSSLSYITTDDVPLNRFPAEALSGVYQFIVGV